MLRLVHAIDRIGPLRWARVVGATVASILCVCCTEEVQVGRNFGAAGAGSLPVPIGSGGAGVEFLPIPPPADAAPAEQAPVQAGACQPAPCGNVTLACGNCIDDDADGRIDASDPECLGPCDDSEDELFTGISPRVNGSCRTDCYFDRNAGPGDDGCHWSYRCDPLALAPNYPPTGLDRCAHDPAEVCQFTPNERSACQNGCLPLTPNGCDCFGCCEIPARSGLFIWLGSESLDLGHCELSSSTDPDLCRPCTPVPDCQNDCAECELCVGETRLNDSCGTAGSPPRPVCSGGRRACEPQNVGECSRLEYCITGCCVPLPT